MLFRLLLLLGIISILLVFAYSNWATVLAVNFGGLSTPALPLAVWVLAAIAAGALTYGIIHLLVQLSSYVTARKVRRFARKQAFRGEVSPNPGRPSFGGSEARQPEATKIQDPVTAWGGAPTAATKKTIRPEATPVTKPMDDWESPINDDWEPILEKSTVPDPESIAPPDVREFESSQAPKKVDRSGSIYSYQYRESNRDEVHRREPAVGKPVIDAEYRLIDPPIQPLEPPSPPSSESSTFEEEPEVDAEDWFEEEEGKSGKATS
jgi:uncharacterized integral membrane protein